MSEVMVNQITLSSREAVLNFLKDKPDVDAEIKWTCPECNAQNIGAYHSHETPCSNCEKFRFPRLYLSKHGIKGTLLDTARAEQERRRILARIHDAEEEISDHQCEIDQLEQDIRDLRSELKDLDYPREA